MWKSIKEFKLNQMEEDILNEMNQLKFIVNFVFDVDIISKKRKIRSMPRVFKKSRNIN